MQGSSSSGSTLFTFASESFMITICHVSATRTLLSAVMMQFLNISSSPTAQEAETVKFFSLSYEILNSLQGEPCRLGQHNAKMMQSLFSLLSIATKEQSQWSMSKERRCVLAYGCSVVQNAIDTFFSSSGCALTHKKARRCSISQMEGWNIFFTSSYTARYGLSAYI